MDPLANIQIDSLPYTCGDLLTGRCFREIDRKGFSTKRLEVSSSWRVNIPTFLWTGLSSTPFPFVFEFFFQVDTAFGAKTRGSFFLLLFEELMESWRFAFWDVRQFTGWRASRNYRLFIVCKRRATINTKFVLVYLFSRCFCTEPADFRLRHVLHLLCPVPLGRNM